MKISNDYWHLFFPGGIPLGQSGIGVRGELSFAQADEKQRC